jgi:uncharacterized membrane protein YbhN (UPF0104 family)
VRLGFREVFVQSAIGETASAISPLRAGGEPVRVWAMGVQGVPSRIAIVAVGLEFVAVVLAIVLASLALGFTVGGDWWRHAGPGLTRSALRSWPWLAGITALTLLAWLLVRRTRPEFLHVAGVEFAAARGHMRDVPVWTYVWCTLLTAIQMAARTAILPVLGLTLASPPPLVAMVVGSFALVYAQSLLPAPAGAGAIELGFLGGAAGNLGAEEVRLLAWWRFYSTILGVILGIVLGMIRFHTNIVTFLFRSGRSGERAGESPAPQRSD